MELEHQGVFFPEKNWNKKATNRRDVCYDVPKKRTGFLHRFPNFTDKKKMFLLTEYSPKKMGCSQTSIDLQGGGL